MKQPSQTKHGRHPILVLKTRDFVIMSLILAALKLDKAIDWPWLGVISPLAIAWLLSKLSPFLKAILLVWRASQRI